MRAMFTMMNAARTRGRRAGHRHRRRRLPEGRRLRPANASRDVRSAATRRGPAPIIEHPDVRRMLLSMRATIEAMRNLTIYNAACARPLPGATDGEDAERRQRDRRDPHAGRQGVVHRRRRAGHLHRGPGVRRHGLHRGVRRRPALPRQAHRADLRGHERHPGDGSGRPQAAVCGWAACSPTTSTACAATRRRAGGRRGPRRNSSRRWPRPSTSCRSPPTGS